MARDKLLGRHSSPSPGHYLSSVQERLEERAEYGQSAEARQVRERTTYSVLAPTSIPGRNYIRLSAISCIERLDTRLLPRAGAFTRLGLYHRGSPSLLSSSTLLSSPVN
ncbi:hypothetical protein J6590_003498 [Homalodisca vitripennis]|nr:hypothetical protein J6590_091301 [Homalodisca vitripennis]KAG8289160.1 hypothetical protein J6590_003498 [Homalodisca vitripennis]